ncbi:MAG: hypothetical protein Q7S55_04905 [Nanoarchaeota archaeon]|nr:hypothetical protein [Nanoarchaeota archaeon]
MTKYIYTEKINIEEIVQRLFDFSTLGALSIPEILTDYARTELLAGIAASRHLFRAVEREKKKSGVIQEMRTFYLERLQEQGEELPQILRNPLKALTEEYAKIYAEIAAKGNFTSQKFSSIGIHHYPVGSAGITPHQDYAADTNLIASFVLQGNAPFGICKNRQKEGALYLEASPGTLILMRAARNEQEQAARPFHFLEGPVQEERYSLLIRDRTAKKMKELE